MMKCVNQTTSLGYQPQQSGKIVPISNEAASLNGYKPYSNEAVSRPGCALPTY